MLVALNTIATATAGTPWPQLVAGSVVTGLAGLVGYVLRAIFKGDLVPRATFEAETDRADQWESSYWRSQDNFSTFGGRFEAVEESIKTIEKALTAMTDPVHREHS